MAKKHADVFADDLDFDADLAHISARDEYGVEAEVTSFGRTFGLVMTSIGAALIILSFVFLVRSFWLATHPKFEFDLPKMPNFSIFYDHGAGQVPTKKPPSVGGVQAPNPMPTSATASATDVLKFSNQIAESHDPLAEKLTQQELVNLGDNMCSSFNRHFLWIDHKSSKAEVLDSFVVSMYAKYPRETGIKTFATILLDASVTHLCPQFKDVK